MAKSTRTNKTAAKTSEVAKKVAKKTTAKKAATKKTTAKGTHRDADVSWTERKIAIFTFLRKAKAVKTLSAMTSQEIAAKVNSKKLTVTAAQVKHYCYHGMAGGLIKVVKVEGKRGNCFHLTSKGNKCKMEN